MANLKQLEFTGDWRGGDGTRVFEAVLDASAHRGLGCPTLENARLSEYCSGVRGPEYAVVRWLNFDVSVVCVVLLDSIRALREE